VSDSAAPASSLLPPGRAVAGRYEVLGPIGEGASGSVYLARDLADAGAPPTARRRVALKVIHRHLCGDRQIFGRFKREAAILSRLQGEHLVGLHEVVEDDGLLVLVLEHASGRSLEDLLRDRAPLPIELAIEITLQICAALGAAHAAGVVHRDLKPANVLVAESPSSPGGVHVRVLDFGLAKIVHGDKMITGLTEQDMIFGTPEYMAPEQARGDEVDARCDLYAAGVMLYEMAVGAVPFRGRTPIASMTAQLTEAPRSPRAARPDLSPALEAVVLRALEKDPEDRFPSARALAEALVGARDEPRVIAPAGVEAASVGLGDTDLHLESAALAHSPTVPAGERSSHVRIGLAPAEAALDRTARAAPVVTLPSPAPAVAPPRRAEAPASRAASAGRGLWVAVAVAAVLVGVVIGVLVGAR
jgi:serine/threonine-protein kinase